MATTPTSTTTITTILQTALTWVLTRAEEPSTYAGTGMLAIGLSAVLGPTKGQVILTALLGLSGVLAILLPEKRSKP